MFVILRTVSPARAVVPIEQHSEARRRQRPPQDSPRFEPVAIEPQTAESLLEQREFEPRVEKRPQGHIARDAIERLKVGQDRHGRSIPNRARRVRLRFRATEMRLNEE